MGWSWGPIEGEDESSEEKKWERSDISANEQTGPGPVPHPLVSEDPIPPSPPGAGQRSFGARFGRPMVMPDEDEDDGEALVEDQEDDDYLEQPVHFYTHY